MKNGIGMQREKKTKVEWKKEKGKEMQCNEKTPQDGKTKTVGLGSYPVERRKSCQEQMSKAVIYAVNL